MSHGAGQCWWVFELKRRNTGDVVVGQISRYLGWILQNRSSNHEHAVGAIIAPKINPKLSTAPRKFETTTLLRPRLWAASRLTSSRPRRCSWATPTSGAAGALAIRLHMHALATRLVPNFRGAVLRYALKANPNLSLWTYDNSFAIKRANI